MATRRERLLAMGRRNRDGHARFPDRHDPYPVHQGDRNYPPAPRDLVADAEHFVDGHRLVSFVLEPFDDAPFVFVARRADEQRSTPRGCIADLIQESRGVDAFGSDAIG